MANIHSRIRVFLVVGVMLYSAGGVSADEQQPKPVAPIEVQSLVVLPAQVQLKGRDDSRQLLVSAPPPRGIEGVQLARGTHAFHAWLVESMAADRPYDEFVRAIVAAAGHEIRHPPALWYKNRTVFRRGGSIEAHAQ